MLKLKTANFHNKMACSLLDSPEIYEPGHQKFCLRGQTQTRLYSHNTVDSVMFMRT